MTAINPARLKVQSAELSAHFSDPDTFLPKLHTLLDFYAVRIQKTSISRPSLTLRSYQVAAPVLRAVERELKESLNTNPSQGLLLIDALWEEEWVETQILAVDLLGALPPINTESIFKRLSYWISSSGAEVIRNILTTRGVSRLRSKNPDLVLDFFQDLLLSPGKGNCQAVLSGLVPFAEDQDFDNLPIIYKLLSTILLVEEKGLIKEILAVLKALIKRSEQETLYFLERQLATAAKPRIIRATRQILAVFSENNQAKLKKTLLTYS
ncbi:MAG: DNA alkylation repair protein [Anaerolineales bacterium]